MQKAHGLHGEAPVCTRGLLWGDDAAADAGRAATAVRRIYDVNGKITDGENRGFPQGPADRWVDDLTALVLDAGMDTFILWAGAQRRQQMEAFATEIAPAVIAAVDAADRRIR